MAVTGLASEYSALAQYNAEHARGIVHTPEWTALMAFVQERWDAQQVRDLEARGLRAIGNGNWIRPEPLEPSSVMARFRRSTSKAKSLCECGHPKRHHHNMKDPAHHSFTVTNCMYCDCHKFVSSKDGPQ